MGRALLAFTYTLCLGPKRKGRCLASCSLLHRSWFTFAGVQGSQMLRFAPLCQARVSLCSTIEM
jgi:hypothetical protein